MQKLLNIFRRQHTAVPVRAAHMTWANSTVGRTASRASLFLQKQLWIRPIIALLVLGSAGYLVRASIERTMKDSLRSQLVTLLNVETAMLLNWFHVQEAHAETLANDPGVRAPIYEILQEVRPTSGDPQAALVTARANLERELEQVMSSYAYTGYFVADKTHTIIAASDVTQLGTGETPRHVGFLNRALHGQTTVCAPFQSQVMLKDSAGRLRNGVPTMFVCAPIRDANFQVVAALALRMRPDAEFTRILQLGQLGRTGETYAFDKQGLLVSMSRFDEELILSGILPDQPDVQSILNLQLRDPGGEMVRGYRPGVRRSELPLTRMALDAIAGHSGNDVEGYRDYRGTPVVGAWRWLPEYDIGIATEVDRQEAFRPLTILQRAFWALFVLLGLSSVAIFIYMVVVERLRREARKATIEAQQLGQYQLEAKLGSGGMGVVYKGFHAMLRRPTAIKMLDVEKVNDASIARFEREVQVTCRLNHPSTIAIYDYGRTPEGVFYYAMEYLDGINLQTLVDRYGPQPESRVIHILQQICGSLYEAHSLGLVHRDIKPANIMLNRRGGETDVAKVLDFGLVKAVDEHGRAGLTVANSLTGTPLYMSPEAIESPDSVDGRSDLYAVGAVGYFLLTGQPVFTAPSLVELVRQHVSEVAVSPSQRLGKPISAEMEAALLACLEKSRAKRPQTARDLSQMLSKSPVVRAWTMDDSDAWWGRHERAAQGEGPITGGPKSASQAVHERTLLSGNG